MLKAKIIGDDELIARKERMPGDIRDALRNELQAAALKLTAHVKKGKLSDQVLRVRTGRLRRSINQAVIDDGNRFLATVGTNVEYAPQHEYGFSGTVGVREHLRKS